MIVSLVMTMWGKVPVVLAASSNPTVTSKLESIEVSDVVNGAVLELYRVSDEGLVATSTPVTGGIYLFSPVVPDREQYYVKQTVNGEVVGYSPFVNSELRKPQASGDVEEVLVSNVYPGAEVKLYESNGTLVNITGELQSDGTVLFKGVTAGINYYTTQSINGVIQGSNTVTVAPKRPKAEGKPGQITVSEFHSGAILKLYQVNGGTLEATSPPVTDPTYTFESVVPRKSQYYVTQTFNNVESTNSDFTSSTLPKPQASVDGNSIKVSSIYPQATVSLYKGDGSLVSDTPDVQPDGTVIFPNLTSRTYYYVQQTINEVISESDTVYVSPDIPVAPVAQGKLESIEVSGFTSGATLKLYQKSDNSLIATSDAVTQIPYLFQAVEPKTGGYYVTQTVNGEQSENSEFVNSELRHPEASADSSSVTISNVYPGATVSLYKKSGELVSSDTPNLQQPDKVTFTGLEKRTQYYAQQQINGVVSVTTSFIELSINTPGRPTAVKGTEYIDVSGFTSGAVLKLYEAETDTLKATSEPVTESTYRFENVIPDSREYYVTQTVNGEESNNSDFIGVDLRKPAGSVGIGYLDVNEVYPGATVSLYLTDGTLVSDSPELQSDGKMRFGNLPAGGEYYVVQSVNGVISEATPWLMIPTVPHAPKNVKATTGNAQATITFEIPRQDGGSPITEYEVTASPGNIQVKGASSPITITGLTNGTSYTFTVKAINAVGSSLASTPSNAVIPALPSSGGGSDSSSGSGNATGGTSSSTQTTVSQGINVLVNGVSEQIGFLTQTTRAGQVVSKVGVDPEKLKQKLAAEGPGALVTIVVPSGADVLIGELDSSMIRDMQQSKAVLKLQTDFATYSLPVQQISLDSLAQGLGGDKALQDMKIQVEMGKPFQAESDAVTRSLQQNQFSLQGMPVEFKVRGTYGDRSVDIHQFNTYVERTITLEKGKTQSGITTGVVVNLDGTVRHVPTRIVLRDGRYEAVINSLSNSTYALIFNQVQFDDVAGHWAQNAVNDMASRKIIEGTGNGNFSPDQYMTRAEFAVIITRALGIAPKALNSTYSDVPQNVWYSAAVGSAHEYNLIQGYADGSYQPNRNITREEAMLLLARAMELRTGPASITEQQARQIIADRGLEKGISSWAIKGAAQMIETGIVTGRSKGDLAPDAFVTRAEVTQMVARLLSKAGLI
ncbi:S-layer homology domain-containing protein [Paenibacillus silvae]|nr:S-layer homology domain-containing protein [Paenibacillus silvae]MCK6077832.1 S-layer homology domain-containing protein [Paenibacillus silvae]MCK6152031.1 S-layer homology domain-containing protein [Paenibacillus silvae]MCK6270716.1 S-layer homology domain-containing protein [Paenibacillus silvae]